MPTIANRVLAAREMIEKDRQSFCDRFGFVYHTVRKWEKEPDPNPGFERFCEVLLSQGVVCDETWLLTGKGIAPYFIKDSPFGAHLQIIRKKDLESRVIKKRLNLEDDSVISQMKSLFKHYPENKIVVGRIRDNTMASFYNKADFCAGLQASLDFKMTQPFVVALVEIEPQRFILRMVKREQNQWKLKEAFQKAFTKVDVLSIRPLVWFHKNETSFSY